MISCIRIKKQLEKVRETYTAKYMQFIESIQKNANEVNSVPTILRSYSLLSISDYGTV